MITLLNFDDEKQIKSNGGFDFELGFDNGTSVVVNTNEVLRNQLESITVLDNNGETTYGKSDQTFKRYKEDIYTYVKNNKDDFLNAYEELRTELWLNEGIDEDTSIGTLQMEDSDDIKDAKNKITEMVAGFNSEVKTIEEAMKDNSPTKREQLENIKKTMLNTDKNNSRVDKKEMFRIYKENEMPYKRLQTFCDYMNHNTDNNLNFELVTFGTENYAKFKDDRFDSFLKNATSFTNIVVHDTESDTYHNIMSPKAFKSLVSGAKFREVAETFLYNDNLEFTGIFNEKNVSEYLGGEMVLPEIDRKAIALTENKDEDNDVYARKMITFDLSIKLAEKYFLNPTNAYHHLKVALREEGFNMQQRSVYVSERMMNAEQVAEVIYNISEKLPWIGEICDDLKVADIGKEYNYSQKLIRSMCDINKIGDADKIMRKKKDENEIEKD